MADPAVLDPFDPLHFPNDFPSDLILPPELLPDLDFDGDIDFSVDDFFDYPDMDGDLLPDAAPVSSHGSNEGSGLSSASPVPATQRSGASGNQDQPSQDSSNSGTCSPVSGNYAALRSPDSGISAMDHAVAAADVKLEEQEERKGWSLKRKKEREEGDGNPNSDGSSNPSRSSKFRRSGPLDEVNSPCAFSGESEEDEKRKARLVRNRESAQLSRQRKKHYVEELEEKVRAMHSTISELNGKISYFMAENASLRQQLGSSGGSCPPPAYPPVPPMAPAPYPWVPFSGYAVRPPGSQVHLIPIPRLKPQQPASAPKSKKSEGKKGESKTKKVASVSLLGLLFCMLFVGFFVPGVDFRNGGYRNLISDGHSYSKNSLLGQSRGRVLTVSGNFHKPNHTDETGLSGGKIVYQKGKQKEGASQPSPSSNGASAPGNASEPLLASLYVPRNDKLVKIDGNLIISSVLASERAISHKSSGVKSCNTATSPGKGSRETGLAIARSLSSALALSGSGRDTGTHSPLYRNPGEHQKALPSRSAGTYSDNLKSTPADGPLKEWFHEGLEGPIFSSGMCTEVFQFDAAPTSGSPGGIIPATSIANATNKQMQNSSCRGKTKNRRALYSQPIPLNGSIANNTEEAFGRHPENDNFHNTKAAKSIIVSVLVDPREAGDGDVDGMIMPKSISRIFVVVLVDSVKYITYSCVLPFKSNAPHLVN